MEQLTRHDPKLPEHDQGTSDPMGCHFGRIDGHRGILGADTDAHDEPRREESSPRLCEG